MAAALKDEPGVELHLVDGSRGEFTVSVGDQVVARKTDTLPSVDQVITAVRDAKPHPAGV